jgi:tetratricopeptide (TPR) repeat protein
MSVQVASNRFIGSSLNRIGAFYQHLFSTISVQQLGKWLIREAEIAQAFRHTDRLEEFGLLLSHLPIGEYQIIGQYYLGWSKFRGGENAQPVFEKVIEQSKTYKTKGLISLGALMFGNRDFPSAIRYYTEALRTENSPSVFVPVARTIAVIKATEGSHKQALKELESILPLARYTDPKSYYDYLNSYAVELGHAGRIEEAQNVSRITLASPYAFAYPEWRETGQDLALRGYRSRSSIRVIQSFPGNLLQMPERELSATRTHPAIFGSAPVTGLKEWKEEKMVKEPNGDDKNDAENLDEMEEKDLIVKLMYLTTQEGKNVNRLRKLVAYAIKVFSEPED